MISNGNGMAMGVCSGIKDCGKGAEWVKCEGGDNVCKVCLFARGVGGRGWGRLKQWVSVAIQTGCKNNVNKIEGTS